ncbi:hypothetical protein TIFTF001_052493 [Ficus carica]|uniref:Uncharacterized protein n=1 Tax=Ficus carica TaxID=3494 RepID=A0AA88EHB1_FICCA|nr:hypothetical protein TIFTF001_052493 [Ficus carica]
MTNTVTDNKVADSSGSSITAGEKDGKKNEGNVSHATSENMSITNHRLRAASFSSENKIPHITKGQNGKINSTMKTVTDNKVVDSSGSCITAGEKDSKKNEGNVSHATSEKTSDQAKK